MPKTWEHIIVTQTLTFSYNVFEKKTFESNSMQNGLCTQPGHLIGNRNETLINTKS